MKQHLCLALPLLAACDPSIKLKAPKCGVSETELHQAVKIVSGMSPYSGKRVGKCDLIVDDTRSVAIITPEIQRSVENMAAVGETSEKAK